MVGLAFGIVSALGAAGKFASGLMSADARQAEFQDQIRQVERKKAYTLSLTKGLSAASGFTMDSASTTEYLKSMTSEFDHSIDSLKRVAGQTSTADMISNLFGLVGSGADAASGLGKLNNWKF